MCPGGGAGATMGLSAGGRRGRHAGVVQRTAPPGMVGAALLVGVMTFVAACDTPQRGASSPTAPPTSGQSTASSRPPGSPADVLAEFISGHSDAAVHSGP